MKKIFSASLVASIILSSAAFALEIDDAKDCPSLAKVSTQTTFDTAENFANNIWGFFNMAGFQHQNTSWHAVFVTMSEEFEPAHALEQGQKFFNNNVKLSNPEVMEGFCFYAKGDGYAFMAASDDSIYKIKNIHLK